MKTVKMSLANIKGKLSRAEMKNVSGGTQVPKDPSTCGNLCTNDGDCSPTSCGLCQNVDGSLMCVAM